MEYFLPTYEEATEIVNNNDSFTFLETKQEFLGYNISTFSYRHVDVNTFLNPIKDKDYNALEFKGLTFIFDKDNSYKRFLMLHKFWILDQYENSRYELFKNKKIKNVYIKEDGYLITFVQFPNNIIYAKTKNGFKLEIVDKAMEIYNRNIKLNNFVIFCIDNNYSPIFEFVSEKNSIVVKYNQDNLILLRIRNNNTGEYIDLDYFNDFIYNLDGIIVCEKVNIYSIDELIELSKTIENIEGWVITFEDDTMLKLKTIWHGKQTKYLQSKFTSSKIILNILNNSKDELISNVNLYDSNKRILIDEVENKLKYYIKDTIEYINKIHSENIKLTKKEFAILFSKDKYFSVLMKSFQSENNIYDFVVKYILNQISKSNTNLINTIFNYEKY